MLTFVFWSSTDAHFCVWSSTDAHFCLLELHWCSLLSLELCRCLFLYCRFIYFFSVLILSFFGWQFCLRSDDFGRVFLFVLFLSLKFGLRNFQLISRYLLQSCLHCTLQQIFVTTLFFRRKKMARKEEKVCDENLLGLRRTENLPACHICQKFIPSR